VRRYVALTAFAFTARKKRSKRVTSSFASQQGYIPETRQTREKIDQMYSMYYILYKKKKNK